MNSLRILDRRWLSVAAVMALIVASTVPALAFAAQVTERSIALSNSSADMAGVTYKVKFTAPNAAGAVVIEFCSNSPLFGATCADSDGFDALATPATAGDFTVTKTEKKVTLVGDIDANVETEVDLTGIHNPTDPGALYARIVTYDTGTNANNYPAGAGVQDQGGVAISITPTVGVSGAVQESLSFCVAKSAILKNCDLTGNQAPTLPLGEDTGGELALVAGTVSTGSIYTQLSTNAVGGAVVSIKSNNACGGLMRLGAAGCDIAPAGITTGVTDEVAAFGLRTAAAATDPSDIGVGEATGTLQAAGSYNDTQYRFNFVDATEGVTSTYGDELLNTDGAPVNNKNMQLTFAAGITNQTPAGLYSTDLSMIATGKL